MPQWIEDSFRKNFKMKAVIVSIAESANILKLGDVEIIELRRF